MNIIHTQVGVKFYQQLPSINFAFAGRYIEHDFIKEIL